MGAMDVREWTSGGLHRHDAGSQQARKGCEVSGNTEWNDANLDHTSKLSAISPSDPLEDAEPGLSSQDRRAIEIGRAHV